MSEEMRKQIDNFRQWNKKQLNENKYNDDNFAGFHCSKNDIKSFNGEITEEYYERFEEILNLIKHDYSEAYNYIERINSGNENFYYETDLAFEITEWFNKNNIKWIYVSETPLKRYGEKCYKVYFLKIKGLYFMEDTAEKDADIYIYNENKTKPVLLKNIQ